MEKNNTPLLDEHLQTLHGMAGADTDEFFYTRLRARMEKEELPQGWSLPLKPVWVVGTLVLLLAVNGFMLTQESKTKKAATENVSTVQGFAESYDQTISSSY